MRFWKRYARTVTMIEYSTVNGYGVRYLRLMLKNIDFVGRETQNIYWTG